MSIIQPRGQPSPLQPPEYDGWYMGTAWWQTSDAQVTDSVWQMHGEKQTAGVSDDYRMSTRICQPHHPGGGGFNQASAAAGKDNEGWRLLF